MPRSWRRSARAAPEAVVDAIFSPRRPARRYCCFSSKFTRRGKLSVPRAQKQIQIDGVDRERINTPRPGRRLCSIANTHLPRRPLRHRYICTPPRRHHVM